MIAALARSLPDTAIVYGTGTFALRVAHELMSLGVGVVGLADHRSGGAVDGFRRLDVQEACADGAAVMLGISNPAADVSALSKHLSEQGAQEVWSPVHIARVLHMHGVALENYWLTGNLDVYPRDLSLLEDVRSQLVDARSRELFDRILAYRMGGDIDSLDRPDPLELQYFPQDVPFLGRDMRFVDAGAYDGDTVRGLRAAGADVAALMALEPDSLNFMELERTVRGWEGVEIVLAPLAIGSALRTLRFSTLGAASSAASPDGDASVQCVALDSLAYGWRPTHIKMDIEGAETDALVGMSRILQDHRPNLAVSVYHSPTDHWSIIRWLASLDLGYRFWMRSYGFQTFDTVVYAVAEARN